MFGKLNNNNGAALIITLALTAMISIVVFMSADRSTTDVELSFNQLHEEQAFYVAEAGMKSAIVELINDGYWRDGFADEDFGDGSYTVTVTDSSTGTITGDTLVIFAVGEVDNAVSQLELLARPVPKRPFEFAMFAESGIALDKNTCTDSYNSDSGSYAATVLDSMGNVGTNGTINAAKDVTFGGSIQTATNGGISLGPFTTFTDSTTAADSVVLDLIVDAEFNWAQANNTAPLGFTGANYTYNTLDNSLVMGSFGNLELAGGTYFFSSMDFGQNSTVTIAPGASVTIYVTGDIHLRQNSTFNNGGSPIDAIIYSKGSSLQFDQDNIFYGAFYGPDAHIQYDQTTEIYGALVGNTIKMDQAACFHFDRNLLNIKKGFLREVERIAWTEIM